MSKREELRKFLIWKISRFQKMNDESARKAVLARLRQAAGKRPDQYPLAWASVLEEMPSELMGETGKPTAAETAAFAALTLFAMAQQGKDPASNSMHSTGVSLGTAFKQYADLENKHEASGKKLLAILSSGSQADLVSKLRSAVKLLASKNIKIDFAQLGTDVYAFAYPEGQQKIRLRWARDFARSKEDKKDAEDLVASAGGKEIVNG